VLVDAPCLSTACLLVGSFVSLAFNSPAQEREGVVSGQILAVHFAEH
jgi:hypothetical protein